MRMKKEAAKAPISNFSTYAILGVVILGLVVINGFMQNSRAENSSAKAVVNSPAVKKAATEFVQKASIANLYEIETSKLALEKSANEDVKIFAENMIDDHKQAGKDLRAVLDSSSVEAKDVPSELDEKHVLAMQKLEALSGAGFDKLYISEQTKAHNEALTLFGNYAKNGKDKALQDFAAKTLPTLQHHDEMVKRLKVR